MQSAFSSTFFLTILLAIGLVFFLRAASKDRTTVVDVQSPLPPLEVLNGIISWLEEVRLLPWAISNKAFCIMIIFLSVYSFTIPSYTSTAICGS